MIKILLFDVDGVLANGEQFSKHLARDYGITRDKISFFFAGPFLECIIGKADLKQVLLPYLHSWGWQDSVEDFLAYWFRAEHSIDEPLIRMVAQYRQQGMRCYIATNQERYRTAYILEQMGFAEAFDGMFSSSQVGCIKQDPAFFLHVLHCLHDIPAQEVLFWDDSATNVETARNLGLHAELYQNFADFIGKMDKYLENA